MRCRSHKLRRNHETILGMTSQSGGWSPAAKTAVTLALIGLFAGGAVAAILFCLPRKGGTTVTWSAGGGEQPTVVRGADQRQADPSPRAEAPTRQPPPTPAMPRHGLTVAFAASHAATAADVRVARLLALAVESDEPAASGLSPGPFVATFTGMLEVELRDRYRFAFEGVGSLTVEIDGKPVLAGDLPAAGRLEGERVRLSKGPNAIVARYQSPATGAAHLRVLWSSSEFAWEALPPTVLRPTPGPELDAAAASRAGHALAMRLQCAACHAGGAAPLGGPDLATVGSRLRPAWLRTWLLTPERGAVTLRSMPHLFDGGATSPADAADVVAFLATLRGDPPAAASADDLVEAGGRTFAHLGCIACHSRPDAVASGDAGRIPLRHVAQKFVPGALEAYLRAPHRHDPMASMPDFGLDADEAAGLAAFLTARAPAAVAGSASSGDAARGRALAARLGCANCHAGTGLEPVAAPAWDSLLGIDCKGPPRFALTVEEKSTLGAVVGKRHVEAVAERGQRLVRGLRCAACHRLDGESDGFTARAAEVADLLPAPAADAHVIDQSRPELTWAGEKLQPSFLLRQLGDAVLPRSRPWLHVRMPTFPGHADAIARGLVASHGLYFTDVPVVADPESTRVGADLVSAEKGFACVTCHGVGPQGPLQVFEVQGVNFARTAERLRPDYFLRWMRDPRRVDPATKMARYSSPEGKTGFTNVLEGDADRQYAAILAWIATLQGR